MTYLADVLRILGEYNPVYVLPGERLGQIPLLSQISGKVRGFLPRQVAGVFDSLLPLQYRLIIAVRQDAVSYQKNPRSDVMEADVTLGCFFKQQPFGCDRNYRKEIIISQKHSGKLGQLEYIQEGGRQGEADQIAGRDAQAFFSYALGPQDPVSALDRIDEDHDPRVQKAQRKVVPDISRMESAQIRSHHADRARAQIDRHQ